jgi:membrane protein DedA with SNARE-associated domain
MLPLMILEGPIVTVFSAAMSALGAFNVFAVFFLSIMGDMIGDVILYGLGYKFGMKFVKNVGKYVGITEDLVLRMEKYFACHGGKTIFVVKSTTGLCWATFTAAGIVKMNIKKFVKFSFLGGVIWSSFLVGAGYFYGYLWREIKQYIEWVGWIISTTAVISFIFINLYKNRKAKKLLAENSNQSANTKSQMFANNR